MFLLCASPIIAGVHRKLFFKSLIVFLLCNLFQQSDTTGQSLSSEQIYQRVGGAVVTINAYDKNENLTAQASGVILNDKGWVVTNYHVLYGNNKIKILLGKDAVSYSDIIGIDPGKDLMILKIKGKKFPQVVIGNAKSLSAGSKVFVIGSALSKDSLVTEGVITKLKNYDGLRSSFIQMTAGISVNNSGGAVVNEKGELIGISTFALSKGKSIYQLIPVEDIFSVSLDSYSKNNRFKDFELFMSGMHSCENEKFYESIEYYSNYIQKYPKDAAAFYNLGFCKNSVMNYSDAVQEFDKAIAISPNYADAFYGRGLARQNLKDYNGAISDYTKAVEINADDVPSLINRARALFELKKYSEAIQDLDKVLTLSPENADAYYYRGLTKDSLQNSKDAVADYKLAAKYDPLYKSKIPKTGREKSNDFITSGNARFEQKDYLGALQNYQKAIDSDPYYCDAYMYHGNCKIMLKDYPNALKDYNKATELQPFDGRLFRVRGQIKHAMGDINGATVDWMKASQLGDKEAGQLMMKFRPK